MELVEIWGWITGIVANLVGFFQWFSSLSININGFEINVVTLFSVGLVGILLAFWLIKLIVG